MGVRTLTAFAFCFEIPPVRSEYGRLVAFPKGAYSDAALFPPELAEWRDRTHRRRLEMHFFRCEILALRSQLSSLGFSLPSDMADVCLSEFHDLADNSPRPAAPRAVWSNARSSSAAASSASEYLAPARVMFT